LDVWHGFFLGKVFHNRLNELRFCRRVS
jgi:hypothetical protein